MNFLAGFFYAGSILALAASTLDDKARALTDALKSAPSAATSLSSPFANGLLAGGNLEKVLQRGDPQAESLATQLMAAHPSAAVRQAGDDFIQALEQQRNQHEQDFSTRADAVLAAAKDAVVHAQKAADLDDLLSKLQGLVNSQEQAFGQDETTQALLQKISQAQQFVTAWQDYLSASANGKTEEEQNTLRRILDNTQLNALQIFPRSEILARLDGEPGTNGSGTSAQDPIKAGDDILSKVKTLDDITPALNQLARIPNQPFDFSAIVALEHERDDVMAGLPITLDLKTAMNGKVFGDDISRIVAMELLFILPSYFDTQTSDPPKPGETLGGYLDRLIATANTSGNLAEVQRVLAVKIAAAQAANQNVSAESFSPPQLFLAGLSQEADDQYASAVVSYEKSLADFNPLVPVKIVGERLAAIKAAHGDEYNQGIATLAIPTNDPRFPPGFPFRPPFVVTVLPIPMEISVPGRTTTSAATTTPPSSTK